MYLGLNRAIRYCESWCGCTCFSSQKPSSPPEQEDEGIQDEEGEGSQEGGGASQEEGEASQEEGEASQEDEEGASQEEGVAEDTKVELHGTTSSC